MSIWPVLGGPEQWPVYRGSAAHIRDGQGPGCDLGNQLDLPWIAVGDGGLVSWGHNDVEAGWFCDLHFTLAGSAWQLRYCHGREQPHPETDEEWTAGGVTARWPVKRGDVIGHVGYSGMVRPAGPAGAHLHNACWRDGVRVEPEVLYALLQETPPQEDEMTEEQKRLHDIGVRAEAHLPGEVGNLQNAIHATDGWASWLESKASATRKMRNQGGKELHDAAKSMRYVLTGVEE